jgi:hypothetical protein
VVVIFKHAGFVNIQETNSALYSLQIGLSNEVSLDIPLRLKKKSWGWLRTSGSSYAKTICVKIAYFQVTNFIPVKVSTTDPVLLKLLE